MNYKYVPYFNQWHYDDFDAYLITEQVFDEQFKGKGLDTWLKKETITIVERSSFLMNRSNMKPKVKRDENNNPVIGDDGEYVIVYETTKQPIADYDEYKAFYSEGYDHTGEIDKGHNYEHYRMTRKRNVECYILTLQDMDDFIDFTNVVDFETWEPITKHYLNGELLPVCVIR